MSQKTVTSLEIDQSFDLFDLETGMLVGRLSKLERTGLVDPKWHASAKMQFPSYTIRNYIYSNLPKTGVHTIRSNAGCRDGRLYVDTRAGNQVVFNILVNNLGLWEEASISVDVEHAKVILREALAQLEGKS